MSARDLAKIGSILLEGGRWNNTVLILEAWIRESTTPYSKTDYDDTDGYGYPWWIDTQRGAYIAVGADDQYLLIDEARNFCIALRKDTGVSITGMLAYRWFDEEIPYATLFALHAIMT
jgi:CubicO group peptidase (beta-lactamase class C family)